MSTLGERIKLVRTKNKLNQENFAKALSVSRSFVSRIESDKEIPSDTVLKLISLQYEVSYAWLIRGTDAYSINDNGGPDYFERGYEQAHKKNAIRTINELMDTAEKINSASIYLAIAAIAQEYKDILEKYKNTKNENIIITDFIASSFLAIINYASSIEEKLNSSKEVSLEHELNTLVSDLDYNITEMQKYFAERINAKKSDNSKKE